jgi:hypothetical protein
MKRAGSERIRHGFQSCTHISAALLHKTNKDSCRESSVVADGHEQTAIAYLQDHELDCLQ